MEIVELSSGDGAFAARVLEALPDWFGIAEARAAYVAHAVAAPMLIAQFDGGPAGYLSFHRHTCAHWEIHSMGVLPAHHRQGAGRALVAAAVAWVRARGGDYLSVKTISARHPDAHYADKRAFYAAMDFEPFEELPTLWGPDLPCLLLLRQL
ncbi:MAG: GNAT family N-acetyltransferase [Pseudomonadota bacterium]